MTRRWSWRQHLYDLGRFPLRHVSLEHTTDRRISRLESLFYYTTGNRRQKYLFLFLLTPLTNSGLIHAQVLIFWRRIIAYDEALDGTTRRGLCFCGQKLVQHGTNLGGWVSQARHLQAPHNWDSWDMLESSGVGWPPTHFRWLEAESNSSSLDILYLSPL